jgi:hypothetical protein
MPPSAIVPNRHSDRRQAALRHLLARRMFEGARLFDRWYIVVVDGTVQKKCRQGFSEGGKSSTNKVDCEIEAFARLSLRLKAEFPKLPLCLRAARLPPDLPPLGQIPFNSA